MMRAWGNRPDTFVVDEPFYAFYLKKTGADHPGAEEVIAAVKGHSEAARQWLAESLVGDEGDPDDFGAAGVKALVACDRAHKAILER